MTDYYGPPKCSECGKFMPWGRSKVVVRSDGLPCPSPVEVEIGCCQTCADRISEELKLMNSQAV